MGNKASSTATTTTTTAAAAHNCLLSAVNGNTALISFQNDFLYGVTAVHEYSLNFPVTPAAVTFPKTSEQVAAIVRCAAEYEYKVQARGGGHSFGNYGGQLFLVNVIWCFSLTWHDMQDSVAQTARSLST